MKMSNQCRIGRKIRTLSTGLSIAAALAAGAPASAQNEGDITLRFASGQDSMSGQLIKFEDNRFTLDSTIGVVVIPAEGVTCIGATCPEGTELVIEAAKVELTSKDNTVTIKGDLIEIDGTDYVIATSVGEQRVPIDLVNCEGEGCITHEAADITPGDVVLKSDSITLTGTLTGYENGSFVLMEPKMGEIRVSAKMFTCEGESCP